MSLIDAAYYLRVLLIKKWKEYSDLEVEIVNGPLDEKIKLPQICILDDKLDFKVISIGSPSTYEVNHTVSIGAYSSPTSLSKTSSNEAKKILFNMVKTIVDIIHANEFKPFKDFGIDEEISLSLSNEWERDDRLKEMFIFGWKTKAKIHYVLP